MYVVFTQAEQFIRSSTTMNASSLEVSRDLAKMAYFSIKLCTCMLRNAYKFHAKSG